MKITFLVSGSIRSNFSYRPLTLARALRAQGHEVSIIAPKADKYNNFVPETISDIDGVKILQPFQFATKRLEVNLIPYIFGAARLLLREKLDLVYIYKPTPISVVGLIARWLRGTPVVSDFDDLGSEVMRIEGHPWYQRMLVAWSEHLAAKYAHRIVVASTYLFDLFRKEYPYKPLLIIPNGVEASWCGDTVPSDTTGRIVFLGSMNRKSILDPLFDALPAIAQKHPEVRVLLIGGGTCLSYFKNRAADLNLTNIVTFTGWLPLEEAYALLQEGDIGYNYMPDEVTNKAASNMKVPQYMARGVVPFVTNIGDLPTTVADGKAGYICSVGDSTSVRDTLLYALADTERMKKAQEARQIATTMLKWDILALTFDRWISSK